MKAMDTVVVERAPGAAATVVGWAVRAKVVVERALVEADRATVVVATAMAEVMLAGDSEVEPLVEGT